jgi:CopG family nickel-responsive transcriptional regulator
MVIISISLDDKILSDLKKVQKTLGFSGRSEVIRAASRMLIEDSREKSKLLGTINESQVSEITHAFEEVIKTRIHNHLKEEKCLEIFIVEGDAKHIQKLLNSFKTSKKIEYAKLIVA